jgi:hypothetical protein
MAKLTKVLKWAQTNGYQVRKSESINMINIKVNEMISFNIDSRESSVFRSCRGNLAGQPKGLFLGGTLVNWKGESYCFNSDRYSTQKELIVSLERKIRESLERMEEYK